MKLNDRIAIITGAASGIGLATAKAFADAGAYVFVGDIAEEQGQQAAVDIRGHRSGDGEVCGSQRGPVRWDMCARGTCRRGT